MLISLGLNSLPGSCGTTGLLRHQRLQKNNKRPKKIWRPNPKSKTQNFIIFSPDLNHLELFNRKSHWFKFKGHNGHSRDVGQTCNLVSWIRFFLLFCSSNINKGEYNYPIGEMEWKYQKQLFQVQKGVNQVIKFNNSKKWQKQTIFMVKLSIKSVFVLFLQN